MKIILIHGIHEREGASNMSVLWPYLQRALPKLQVHLHSYGFMGFWRARLDNPRQARRLAAAIEPGDIVVTHSNGAAITYLACRDYGAQPGGVININPALDRWLTARAPWVETIHSNGDRWVWLSQWVPFHIWGDQGRVGYRGDAWQTINHNASHFGDMAYSGHCDLFSQHRVAKWAEFIAVRIGERAEEANYARNEAARIRASIGLFIPGVAA